MIFKTVTDRQQGCHQNKPLFQILLLFSSCCLSVQLGFLWKICCISSDFRSRYSESSREAVWGPGAQEGMKAGPQSSPLIPLALRTLQSHLGQGCCKQINPTQEPEGPNSTCGSAKYLSELCTGGRSMNLSNRGDPGRVKTA